MSFFERKKRLKTSSGVDLVGYLDTQNGVGRAGRLIQSALAHVDYPVHAISVSEPSERIVLKKRVTQKLTSDVVIMSIDGHTFRLTQDLFKRQKISNRYVIAQWFWELEMVPDFYNDALCLIDELWVPTDFLRNSFSKMAPANVQIRKMPLPLYSENQMFDNQIRNRLGLSENFMFLFVFDYLSVMKRKNPLGLVEAFVKAFPHNSGPILVIKTINGDLRKAERSQLMERCARRKDIFLIEKDLDRDSLLSLVKTCDVYVSAHRSEGLGFTLAEAMSFEKPVIATGYSGNLDFMNNVNSILIPYSLVAVGDNAEGYPPTSFWAEPDLAAVSQAMQKLFINPNLCLTLGREGKQTLKEQFSLEVTGMRMCNRLEEIRYGFND